MKAETESKPAATSTAPEDQANANNNTIMKPPTETTATETKGVADAKNAATNATASTLAATSATIKKAHPPAVITVDTNGGPSDDKGDSEVGPSESDKKFGQAQTPKHANKARDGGTDKHGTTGGVKSFTGGEQQRRAQYSNYPPRPYEGRPLGGSGAFQPHEPRRPVAHGPGNRAYYEGQPPVQVSPGAAGGDFHRPGQYHGRAPHSRPDVPFSGHPPHHPPPPPHAGYYDQRYGPGYEGRPPMGYEGRGPPPPSQGYRGQYPTSHQYPVQSSYNAFPPQDSVISTQPSWGSHPPPPYHQQGRFPPNGSMRPDSYQQQAQRQQPPPQQQRHRSIPHEGYHVSRAVSSSFDRSITKDKSAAGIDDAMASAKIAAANNLTVQPPVEREQAPPDNDATDDASWGQLNLVQSVDENAMRERINSNREANKDSELNPPRSNSSSLTNSPTEGVDRRHARKAEETMAAAAKRASSLDSLCSVASTQEPLETRKLKNPPGIRASSPAGSESASLDLMKCSSGSSGLLHLPANHRGQDGFPADMKRGRDEEREDMDTSTTNERMDDELRRAPSAEYVSLKSEAGSQRPSKKQRRQDDESDMRVKQSPLSIACSPPTSPGGTKHRNILASADVRLGQMNMKTEYHASPQPMHDSYFDKSALYSSYSLDSAPSMPKEGGHHRKSSPPSLPPRPGSSTSSTVAPKDQFNGDKDVDNQSFSNAVVPSIPSWEIHAQDSFGAGSIGGGQGLGATFSFQDYPMLSASESNLGVNYGAHDDVSGRDSALSHQMSVHDHKKEAHHPIESRHLPPSQPPLESRNQSFDGYHRAGSFHRSDSIDMPYSDPHGRPMYTDAYGKPQHQHQMQMQPQPQGHQGSFPPHSASWATADSASSHPSQFRQPGPPVHYGGQFAGRPSYGHPPPQMMRNFSHDSGHTRTSPPPGHGTGPPPMRMRMSQNPPPMGGFQPPPEFVAPHNPHLTRRPPPTVYIMSRSEDDKSKDANGSFSWSKDDDSRLTDIMKKYKNPRDWEPISKEHGGGKTAKECHERWIRYLKPGVRKGQWTDHEDAIVIEVVTTSTEQPFTRWSDLAQRLPGRVGKQIRDRWVNHLNPNINHLPFSREDDLLLWDGHKKVGKRWVEISTKFFKCTRSENHIKNRWYSASFKKFISNEFGPDAYSSGKRSGSSGKPKKKTKGQSKDEAEIDVI